MWVPSSRLDGPPGGRGVGRLPPEPAHGGARSRRSTAQGIRTGNAQRPRRPRRSRPDGFGYFLEMATRPQTIGYALLDSPVALAAWLLDHDTDSYYKISRAFVDGEPVGNLPRDHILDNITLYWLTGTAASAARSYWEDGRALAAALAERPASSGGQGAGRLPPPSPARSGRRPGAGSRRSTPTSPTSTRSIGAATSPPGRSRNCSPRRSGGVPVPALRQPALGLTVTTWSTTTSPVCGSTDTR